MYSGNVLSLLHSSTSHNSYNKIEQIRYFSQIYQCIADFSYIDVSNRAITHDTFRIIYWPNYYPTVFYLLHFMLPLLIPIQLGICTALLFREF